jgi:hypothetical protein
MKILSRRLLPLPAPLLFLAVAFPGCAPERSAESGIHGEWVAEEEARGDTTVVRTVAGSVWGDTMVLVPEFVIGEHDGDDPYVLGSVGGVGRDAEGRILVLDDIAREVRVFASDGQFLHRIGGAGEGPGEFQNPTGLRVASDGRVVVRDAGVGGFHVFEPDGEFLRGGWPGQPTIVGGLPFFLDDADRVLDPSVADPSVGPRERRMHVVRYELDGQPLDTLTIPTSEIEEPYIEFSVQGGISRFSIPLSPTDHWTVTPAGEVVFGTSTDYRIDRHDRDGKVLRVERVTDPVPVGSEERAGFRETVTAAVRRSAGDGWRWDGPEIPSVKPHFQRLVAGADGTLWVFRHTPAAEEENPYWDPDRPETGPPTWWREPTVADVFDAEGRFLGPVAFPDELRFHSSRGVYTPPILEEESVLAGALHELGHPQVVRYRLVPASEGEEADR